MFAISTNNVVSTQFARQQTKISSSSVRSTSRKSCHQKKIVTITKAAFKTDNSQKIFQEAQDLLPGGVNSPVRAFKSVGGQPIVFDRVKGPCAYRFLLQITRRDWIKLGLAHLFSCIKKKDLSLFFSFFSSLLLSFFLCASNKN